MRYKIIILLLTLIFISAICGCSTTVTVVYNDGKPVKNALILSRESGVFSNSEYAYNTDANGKVKGSFGEIVVLKKGFFPVFKLHDDGFFKQKAVLWDLKNPGNIKTYENKLNWLKNKYDITNDWVDVGFRLPFDIGISARKGDEYPTLKEEKVSTFADPPDDNSYNTDYKITAIYGYLLKSNTFFRETLSPKNKPEKEIILANGGVFYVFDKNMRPVGKVKISNSTQTSDPRVPAHLILMTADVISAELFGSGAAIHPSLDWIALYNWISFPLSESYRGDIPEEKLKKDIDSYLLSLEDFIDKGKCLKRIRPGVYYSHMEEKAILERIVDIKNHALEN